MDGRENMPLEKSPFSFHFTALGIHGGWKIRAKTRCGKTLLAVYQYVMTYMRILGVFSLVASLMSVRHNLKKFTWGLCINIVFTGGTLKNLDMFRNRRILDRLRVRLHRDMIESKMAEHEESQANALNELIVMRWCFYGCAITFSAIWLVIEWTFFSMGKTELPIPIETEKLKMELESLNRSQVIAVFIFLSLGGMAAAHFIMETEMTVFSLFIQISREYNIFMKDLMKLDEAYGDVIPVTERRKTNVKNLMREYINRQQKLNEYTQILEKCLNKFMIAHIFGISAAAHFNAILCLMVAQNFTPDILFQVGLLVIVVLDMFLICWFSQKLTSQCIQVGHVIYSLCWYKMDADLRKYLSLMILRSQNPPKLTAAKIIELNLHTFAILIKNIYSWVMFFQQLGIGKY